MSNGFKIPVALIGVSVSLLIGYGVLQAQVGNNGEDIEENCTYIKETDKALTSHMMVAQKQYSQAVMKQQQHNGEVLTVLAEMKKDIQYMRNNNG